MIRPVAAPADPEQSQTLRWAAERTLLAWLRTSLALFGLGLVLARLFVTIDLVGNPGGQSVRPAASVASQALGTAFVVIGTLVTAAAAFQYRAFVLENSSSNRLPSSATMSFVTSALVATMGLLLALSLVVFPA